MANVQKYKASSMGHMFAHYERRKDEHDEYIKYGNQSIDTSKTHLNYNLAENHNQLEFVKKRLEEVHTFKRKDLNIFATWVITAPKDLPPEQERDFFKTSYDFLCDRYGKENCISAYVHKDETTPHMHFCFMPIVKNGKFRGKIVDKLSAKEVLTQTDLKSFHKDLQKAMDKQHIHCLVENGITAINGNKTVNELKKELAQQNSEIAVAKEKLNAANAEATKIKNELNSITQDNLTNSQKISSVKKLIADFEKCFHSIPIVGGYQVSNTDYKKVCKTFQKIMLTGNDLDSKSAKVEEKLNSLAKVEEKLKRQEEVNDKKANELRVKEQNLLNRNSLLSVTELENASLKLKQQAYSSNVSEIVELLNKFFKGNIPLELKKVLLKAFQEVGLKPNEKLNLDTSDLDKTKNKKIERSNYFER